MRVGIFGLTHYMLSLASAPSGTASIRPRARAPNHSTS